VTAGLERLPGDERRVLLLRFFEGKTFDEIASDLSRSRSAVYETYRRALSRIRRLLEP
jgi:RNA polymerase sigma factor (sigma-70 family)